MIKLTKYLKPYLILIVAAIVLLFVQAMSDLALPDYMSRIVNNGIQQGGIENAVPKAVRQSQMDRLTLFMSQEEEEKVMENYELIDKDNEKFNVLVKEFPTLNTENIYVLNDIEKTEIEAMNLPMAKAFLAISSIETMKDKISNETMDFNGMKIPEGTNIYDFIENLPKEQLDMITQQMDEQFAAMGESMLLQSAIPLVKGEYESLGANTDKIQNNYIIKTGIFMLLISLLVVACTISVGFLSARIGAGLSRDLRRDVFQKIQRFSNAEFDKFSTASLITRTTNDITQIQMLIIIMIRMLFFAPIMGIGGIIRAMSKSTSMTWIIGIAVVLLLLLIAVVFSIAMPKFKIIQKLVDRLNLVSRENLSGMMVIRAFNTQQFEENRFDKANKKLTDTNLFVNRVMVTLFPTMTLIMNGVTLLIIWIGAGQIENSAMQVGDMMAFMQYTMQIIFSFLMMSIMFIMIPRASVSAQRIAEVLEEKPSILDPKRSKNFDETMKGIVEFNDVSFRYPGAKEDALKNINFKALPGQTTAFIGSTGSGKTTLINLIPRFYDVTAGQIKIGGLDVRDTTQHELRNKIGYVPQKSFLFSGTIESNLKYGRDNATNQEIETAAQIAQAEDFISEKPERFKSPISQGGSNVSGGQKQRLSIARALAKNPDIYIFDDSFSALDFKTDAALRTALKEKTESSTILLVAQRISTIIDAEKIIVLDDGKIVGTGTHKELLENCEVYREIAFSQLSKEELA